MKSPASPTDADTIVLTRTRAATFRWYARTTTGRVAFVTLAVAVALAIVAASWTSISSWAERTSVDVASGIVGTPTSSPAPTVDVRGILRSQQALSDEISKARQVSVDAKPYPALTHDRDVLGRAITAAEQARDEASSKRALDSAVKNLRAAVGDLPARTAKAKAEQDRKNAQAAKEKADRERAAREAAKQQQPATPERQQQPKPAAPAPAAPAAPAPAAPAPAAPAPAPAPATARTSVTARCTTAATITFTATGGGTVTISAGGRSSSGSGSATVTVSGGPGGYTASASGAGSVRISYSSQGACS